jgi:hypothetical protein
MGWTSYAVLAMILVIIFTVGAFGAHIGYTVNGIPTASEVSGENPGIFGALGWVWDSIQFFFDLLTFRIDGMPAWFSYVMILLLLMVIFIIVKLIRGTD